MQLLGHPVSQFVNVFLCEIWICAKEFLVVDSFIQAAFHHRVTQNKWSLVCIFFSFFSVSHTYIFVIPLLRLIRNVEKHNKRTIYEVCLVQTTSHPCHVFSFIPKPIHSIHMCVHMCMCEDRYAHTHAYAHANASIPAYV